MDALRFDLKAALRRRIRTARRRAAGQDGAAEARSAEARGILEHGAPLVELVRRAAAAGGTPRVAAFHPTPLEADPLPLVEALQEAGAQIVLPAAPQPASAAPAGTDAPADPARAGAAPSPAPDRPAELDWVVFTGREQVAASPAAGFGDEPQGARLGADALAGALLVLAPAVAIDATGARIGHGAGYYDRALARAGGEVLVVAVVHPGEVLPPGAVPTGPQDVPVHAVLTADGLRRLRRHPLLGDRIDGGA